MAIEYGLTADGFKRKRLPEIIASLGDRISDKLGVEIQRNANSMFGQLIGVYAYEINSLWQLAENVYNAMYPSTAQGVQLDNAAGLAGIIPIGAEYTTIIATCYGNEGTIVPYGAEISSSADSTIWSCLDPGETITANRACDVTVKVDSFSVGNTYSLTIDGVTKSYTATSIDDSVSVLAKLAALFDFEDKTFNIVDDGLNVSTVEQSQTFTVFTSSNLSFSSLGSPFHFACTTAGAIEPKIGTVTNIVTGVTGWERVSNNVAANVGRNAESDIALRQRWSASVYGRAYAMVDAIAAAIYQQDGVTAVRVYENTSDEEDEEGRPPHSVEAVVSGGEPQAICNTLFRRKAAGIDTYGEISRIVYDSQGIPHRIFYNEPQDVKIWLRVVVTTDDAEGDFGGLQNVRDALLEAGANYRVGEDVILQKFFCPIYSNVTGIGYVTITAAAGETPGAYTANNIEIDPRHRAVFDASRIEVSAT